jgi:hypothetical protein
MDCPGLRSARHPNFTMWRSSNSMVTLSYGVTDPGASIKDEHHGEVRKLRDKIADRGGVNQANQTLARLHAMFAGAVAGIAAFPAASIKKRVTADGRPH